MRWSALLPLLLDEQKGPPLQILLVHLGGSDLGLIKGKALIIQARDELVELKARWPGAYIIFSAVLPHRVWWGQGDPRCLGKVCYQVNREMKKALIRSLGQFLPHPDIRVEFAQLNRLDVIHMPEEGNDMFLKDLRLGLCAALGC